MKRWDDSGSRSPRAPGSLPKGTRQGNEEARTRGGLSGDPGKEGQLATPSTGDPVTWARRMKMRSTPDPAPPGATVLWGNRGGGNVVIWRDLPTGKGERPSSHTPEPEDDNHVVGGRLGFVPGRTPRTRILSSPHPSTWNGKRLASSRTPSQYGGKGRNRVGFGRLSFDDNDGRGSPREDPKDV